MIAIENKTRPALSRENLDSLNFKTEAALSKDSIRELNHKKWGEAACSRKEEVPQKERRKEKEIRAAGSASSEQGRSQKLPDMVMPPLRNRLFKGQKTALQFSGGNLPKLKVCFGWNVKDARCDMDASAFLLTENGKVADESWFVFYGQTESPDHAADFAKDPQGKDREIIRLDLERLSASVQKIVFVLTINEAFENRLNFSMIGDAYVRILEADSGQELVSYQLEEYYANVTSMTIGELYRHKGQWKFNPVGNGVQQDLAGQCAIYGVEIC